MQKFIPHLILLMSTMLLLNCRQVEEINGESISEITTLNKNAESTDSVKLKPELDPDPPVKDGQDWKH